MTYHLTVSSVFRNQNANTEAHGWMSRKICAEWFTKIAQSGNGQLPNRWGNTFPNKGRKFSLGH